MFLGPTSYHLVGLCLGTDHLSFSGSVFRDRPFIIQWVCAQGPTIYHLVDLCLGTDHLSFSGSVFRDRPFIIQWVCVSFSGSVIRDQPFITQWVCGQGPTIYHLVGLCFTPSHIFFYQQTSLPLNQILFLYPSFPPGVLTSLLLSYTYQFSVH